MSNILTVGQRGPFDSGADSYTDTTFETVYASVKNIMDGKDEILLLQAATGNAVRLRSQDAVANDRYCYVIGMSDGDFIKCGGSSSDKPKLHFVWHGIDPKTKQPFDTGKVLWDDHSSAETAYQR